jgi:hypothetical protein
MRWNYRHREGHVLQPNALLDGDQYHWRFSTTDFPFLSTINNQGGADESPPVRHVFLAARLVFKINILSEITLEKSRLL